tara:strand:- start:827 stop:1039 length:213 start_codon:yes stop_codon:yes gene_type:complete
MTKVTISVVNDDKVTLPNHQNNITLKSAKVDTDLVNALEKLVKLQQQGFLTVNEFEQVKTKLLTSVNKAE